VIIPLPPIPANAVRAHPLAPLPRTDSAAAAVTDTLVQAHRRHVRSRVTYAKPRGEFIFAAAKVDPDRAPKHDDLEAAQI
jgi:hypothetical protein